ncbi:DEAD/DEAH box helicase family protein [Eubacteriaceae bacterium ES2]|nr:DEAD/DEAH box helicase family protein [Eubacteriaceae bacterium ES2]
MAAYETSRKPVRNCLTGNDNQIIGQLKRAIGAACRIDFNVSFLMASGVRLVVDDLKAAADRGVPIRILCGSYLNITQPEALYLLKDAIPAGLDLRFYDEKNRSFHPKAYFFTYPEYEEVYVGSSNLSKSALTTGIEWNVRFDSRHQPADCAFLKNAFEDLFANHGEVIDKDRLRDYARSWIRPQVYKQLEAVADEENRPDDQVTQNRVAHPTAAYQVDRQETPPLIAFPQPKDAQIEVLYALKKARSEGQEQGLVVAATGIGKTFLAAFDSKNFKRILFVAHRDEILAQAQATFNCVQPGRTSGRFDGSQKDGQAQMIFASVTTLGKADWLNSDYFAPDAFDYIIIDEFHHAVADSYRAILDYFKPAFLLGLTATPERLDNQDVFALCDYNLVYELRLKEAINRGFLAPFRYYGIYDEMDYGQVGIRNGQYIEAELEALASVARRGDLIFAHYQKYQSRRALAFCINRKHALFMTDYFQQRGIACCAVISGGTDQSDLVCARDEAVKKLKTGELKVIFSVDMFNEGLDIPELDMVLFLRPTQSPTVFLQQLGRGLRKSRDKNYVNVLDFIGNYKKANLIPFLLTSGEGQKSGTKSGYSLPPEEDFPSDCFVDFDFRLIDLFKKMDKDSRKAIDRIIDEYWRIRDYCGHRPTRTEFYVYLDNDLYRMLRSRKELNVFNDYLGFLKQTSELTQEEEALIGSVGHDFLKRMERTSMSKTYKMPVLLAFWNDGRMKTRVTDDDLVRSFVSFYQKPSNRIDLLRDTSTRDFERWGNKEIISLMKRNPLYFLQKTEHEFFRQENDLFCLSRTLEGFVADPTFVKHFKDIIDYRTTRFYRERLENLNV